MEASTIEIIADIATIALEVILFLYFSVCVYVVFKMRPDHHVDSLLELAIGLQDVEGRVDALENGIKDGFTISISRDAEGRFNGGKIVAGGKQDGE